MFKMQVERTMDLNDRTLILGIPEYDVIPDVVFIGGKKYRVLGVSHGAKYPYMSLEIERSNKHLDGMIVTA